MIGLSLAAGLSATVMLTGAVATAQSSGSNQGLHGEV